MQGRLFIVYNKMEYRPNLSRIIKNYFIRLWDLFATISFVFFMATLYPTQPESSWCLILSKKDILCDFFIFFGKFVFVL